MKLKANPITSSREDVGDAWELLCATAELIGKRPAILSITHKLTRP